MRKKLWEMTLCILYFMTLLYQLKTAEVISFKLELPMGAGAGCRIRAVIDISGNRDKSLDVILNYDSTRLSYTKGTGTDGIEQLYISSRPSDTGVEMILEISGFTGNSFWGRGKIELEFYVRKPCRDASQFINFYNLNMKKEKNHPCRIDNIFRKNYNNLNGQKKEHYLETKNR